LNHQEDIVASHETVPIAENNETGDLTLEICTSKLPTDLRSDSGHRTPTPRLDDDENSRVSPVNNHCQKTKGYV